ncbi:olfactory receptor 14A16-like [Emydura macquarii macquarii]|uniref:olfactory receptor 14A16-like n=1 Tax=Emydura macquarii macquarii TaxID=1129001 RepID=UPI00352A59D7
MAAPEEGNQTSITEFILLGFGTLPKLQILRFLLFLVIYITTMAGNILIMVLVVTDEHLHTPIYFFLGNLSCLETCYASTILLRMLASLLTGDRTISVSGCITQYYFFSSLLATECLLLSVMSYDRYVAICQLLHYERVMNMGACVQMAARAWASGVLYAALHTGNTFAVSFCRGNKVDQFFCDIPQLLKLTCSDSNLTEKGVILFSVGLALCCFVFITVSYVQIISTVLGIPSEQGRHKAFSTCLPHLTVLSLLVFTGCFAYLKPLSSSTSWLDLVVAVFYSVLPPVMNPIICSMRNKEIKASLWKLTGWRLSTKD